MDVLHRWRTSATDERGTPAAYTAGRPPVSQAIASMAQTLRRAVRGLDDRRVRRDGTMPN
jgi:hypothetical protein